jgi:hypothetical protein
MNYTSLKTNPNELNAHLELYFSLTFIFIYIYIFIRKIILSVIE